LMSMALIAAPNLKLNKDNNESTMPNDISMEENQMQQNRRALLFDTREKFGDAVADEEMSNDFSLFCDKIENNEHNYATDVKPFDTKMGDLIDTLDLDDDPIWVPPNGTSYGEMPSMNIATSDTNNMMKMIQMDFPSDRFDCVSVTHAKSAKNLSDLPTENGYQLKLEPNGIPNIILNTEIDAKNV